MAQGRIIVPTDEALWPTIQARASDPDAFIAAKNAEYLAGDHGRPRITAEVIASIAD
jgi:hypothetical protein